jgi:hypothetical protein
VRVGETEVLINGKPLTVDGFSFRSTVRRAVREARDLSASYSFTVKIKRDQWSGMLTFAFGEPPTRYWARRLESVRRRRNRGRS